MRRLVVGGGLGIAACLTGALLSSGASARQAADTITVSGVAPEHAPEPRMEARRDWLRLGDIRDFGDLGGRRGLHRARLEASVPEIDLQAVDLVDEHQDRATGGGELLVVRLS